MVLFLNSFDLRVWMDGGSSHILECLIKGLPHLGNRRLLLVIRILSLLHSHIRFLHEERGTMPSLRMILSLVSHLLLRSNLGKAL